MWSCTGDKSLFFLPSISGGTALRVCVHGCFFAGIFHESGQPRSTALGETCADLGRPGPVAALLRSQIALQDGVLLREPQELYGSHLMADIRTSSLPLTACSLAPATREVKVSCWEDVDLPCTAPWDPHVPYVASWTKFKEDSEESVEIPQEDLHLGGQHSHQQGQNGSSEAPRERPYSLKIRNTTSCNSGTYKCTLQELHGLRNLSGTVILQVTGCPTGRKEANFQKYRAEIVLLLALVVFYLTLIIFTCKFARLQSIFPDFSKPGMEQAFLPVTFPGKHLGPVTLQKTEVV
uniref:CD83 antigen n=1 Tax=Oryctolagus cuniculus TaxID=9986 RepID=G1SJF6_RABIT